MSNEVKVQEWTVSSAEGGERLDRFLASKIGDWSRSKLQEVIKSGLVDVGDHAQVKSGTVLVPGDRVVAHLPEAHSEFSPDLLEELNILFEDEDMLVVDKPGGMLTHRSEGGTEVSLADLAEAHCGPLPSPQGEDRPGIVHRLDRETSGVLVLGKNEASLAELMRQFREREVQKSYGALVGGVVRFQSDWIDEPLGRNERNPERMSLLSVDHGGRAASTYYELLERFGEIAYLLCQPKTGRTHQIRVHLCSIGLMVLGDKVYKPRNVKPVRLPADMPQVRRQMLHAHKLELSHPRSGEALEFEVPLPSDFAALLDWLRESVKEA